MRPNACSLSTLKQSSGVLGVDLALLGGENENRRGSAGVLNAYHTAPATLHDRCLLIPVIILHPAMMVLNLPNAIILSNVCGMGHGQTGKTTREVCCWESETC